MNKPLLAVVCVFMSLGLNAQRTLFVSPTGSGDGSSWVSSSSLHNALQSAESGDQLWLQEGTYLTASDANRNVYFDVPAGVRLLGGFAGREKNASARNPRDQKTILSGEIGKKERSDNAARDGGGVYIDGSSGKAKPSFVNCTFRKNEADLDGGAIYNDGRRRGEASPSLVDCTFESNVANYGGAPR